MAEYSITVRLMLPFKRAMEEAEKALQAEGFVVINQNFLLGLGFVLGGIVLGGMNILSPVAAAMFHVSGSLLVVLNSFRWMRQGEDLQPHEPVGFPSLAAAGSGT
jgi:hypothetical protein